MTTCVIPARGGSKRIPRKNIKEFFGRPIICWSIEVAMASGIFDEILVSTDDEEIADVARNAGASVPWLRPDNLADDYADTVSVVAHAIESLRQSRDSKFVCCIYPAAPFIKPEWICDTFEMISLGDIDYVIPVTQYPYPIQRALRMDELNNVGMVDDAAYGQRSQDLPIRYHDAGQFYWGKESAWRNGLPILSSKSRGYEIPKGSAVDIDSPDDWLLAELLFKVDKPSLPDD